MLICTVCDEVMKNAGRNQVLIYVHSGEGASKMAIGIRDLCKKHSSGRQLLEENSPSRQELSNKATRAQVCLLHNMYRVSFGGWRGICPSLDPKCPPLEFESKAVRHV